MLEFQEWLFLGEASVSDEALLNYYLHVHKSPRLDDVLTLVGMLEREKEGRNSPVVARMLDSLESRTVPKMPAGERAEAVEEIRAARDRALGLKPWSGLRRPPEGDFEVAHASLNPESYLGDKFQEDVMEYVSTRYGFDLEGFLRGSPEGEVDADVEGASDWVLNLIDAQFRTGVLDVSGAARRVMDYLRGAGLA